jgi:hypothetical protein
VLIPLSAVFVDLAAQAVTLPALKAAFLFNFRKFVVWPVDLSPAGRSCVCVLDDRAVEDALAQLTGGAPATGKSVTLDKDASHQIVAGMACALPGRSRFDAARAGLRLSSRLLSLAKIVREGRHGQS